MPNVRVIALTSLAMIAFAGNSLLCRIALKETAIDAASFTTIRLVSGALMLFIIVLVRQGRASDKGRSDDKGDKSDDSEKSLGGNWLSALALFAYAAGFSFAYISLTTATGALLLFGAVQATMISYGLWTGERLRHLQIIGLVLALGGLIGLLLPGLSAPPLTASLLMVGAGVAWAIYSLRGKSGGDPTKVTTGNFLRAAPIALVLSLLLLADISLDSAGFWYAVASGTLASGVGYAVWYSALPMLKSTHAATVQLSVPVIAAVGGFAVLGEPITLRVALASLAILGGIALVIMEKQKANL